MPSVAYTLWLLPGSDPMAQQSLASPHATEWTLLPEAGMDVVVQELPPLVVDTKSSSRVPLMFVNTQCIESGQARP